MNQYGGLKPEQPSCVDLSEFDQNYYDMESLGLKECGSLAIVLVAGGLGERLGYEGIKIDIFLICNELGTGRAEPTNMAAKNFNLPVWQSLACP